MFKRYNNRKQEEKEGVTDMPQVDVQWPSEDENSDAKNNKDGSKSAVVKSAPTVSEDAEEPDQKHDSTGESSADNEQAVSEVTSQQDGNEEPTSRAESHGNGNPETLAVSDDQAKVTSSKQTTKPPVEKPGSSKKNMVFTRIAIEAILVLAVVVLGLWSWSLYNDRKDLQTQVANLNVNPQVAVQKQNQILIGQVGKLIQLPKNETPTIALVSNVTEARKQSAFFNNAQNGDKVLLYVKAQEAILYRPSTNKIILVAPLNFNTSAATTPK